MGIWQAFPTLTNFLCWVTFVHHSPRQPFGFPFEDSSVQKNGPMTTVASFQAEGFVPGQDEQMDTSCMHVVRFVLQWDRSLWGIFIDLFFLACVCRYRECHVHLP